MGESTNDLLEGINLHDAEVTDVIFEGEKVVFDIPQGLRVGEVPFDKRRPCKLQFTPDVLVLVYLGRQYHSFGRARWRVKDLELDELKKELAKGRSFEIIDWFIRDYDFRLECSMGFRRPLLIEVPTHDLKFIED